MTRGPRSSAIYGNGMSIGIGYDTDYRRTYTTSGAYRTTLDYDVLDRVSSITNHLYSPLSQSFTYDADSRLTGVTAAAGNQAFTYDLDGNRESHTWGGIVDDYSGGVYNPHWGAMGCMVFHGGGHAATDDNSVVILDFNDLTFKRLSTPSMDAAGWAASPLLEPYGEYADGQPGACHTYDNLAILPPDAGGGPNGSLIRVQSQAIEYHRSVNSDWAHRFDMAIGQERQHTGRWTRWVGSSMKPFNPGGCSAYDPKRKRFWYLGGLGYSQPTAVRYLDVGTSTKAEAAVSTPAPSSGADAPIMRYDADRDLLLLSVARNDGRASVWWARPWNREGWIDSRLELPKQTNASTVPFDLVTHTGRYAFLTRADPGAVFEVTIPNDPRDTWSMTRRPITGAPIPQAWVVGKRWSYAPAMKAFVWYARSTGPVVAYRPLGV